MLLKKEENTEDLEMKNKIAQNTNLIDLEDNIEDISQIEQKDQGDGKQEMKSKELRESNKGSDQQTKKMKEMKSSEELHKKIPQN